MAEHDTGAIRNVALLGHSGSGKTSLLERLLVRAGVLGEAGSLERGTTVSDFDPLEKAYQHSLNASIASLSFDGVHVNFLDTPGDPDFRGQALAAMSAAETSAVVINAAAGIEMSTRRLMRRARQRKRCRIIVINRIDVEGADLEAGARYSRYLRRGVPAHQPSDG